MGEEEAQDRQKEDGGVYMVWTFHHILLDGWSVPILMGEFLDAYSKINQSDIAQAASKRASLFLSPSKLSTSEQKKLTKWNTKIWDKG